MSGGRVIDIINGVNVTEMDCVRGALMHAAANGLSIQSVIQAAAFDECNSVEDFDTAISVAVKIRELLK